MFVNGKAEPNENVDTQGKMDVSRTKVVRKELQEIRDRVNYLLDSLDASGEVDRFGVSAMAAALQEKSSAIGVTSSLDPAESRSSPTLNPTSMPNGSFQQNSITSERSKEFDPFNTTAQKTSNTIQ